MPLFRNLTKRNFSTIKILIMNKIEFALKHGLNEMDFNRVAELLSEANWSIGIKKVEVIQGAENSAMVVGAFTSDNEQIGYARVVSDKTRFAYIMDVMVDKRYRKQGIGQALVQYMLTHPEMKDVYQWLLLTKDAHGVYKKLGFNPITQPDNWMEIRYSRPQR
jgi:N-acetylglutamate synthase-like GNAT family acetyltransferase